MVPRDERRIVFLDVDGTIVDGDRGIPASTEDAIRRARSNGHLVFVASGRSAVELDTRLDEIGFDGVVVCAGAFARLGGEWLIERTMPEEAAARMIAAFETLGFDYTLQARDDVHPSRGLRERVRRVAADEGVPMPTAPRRGLARNLVDTGPAPRDGIAKGIFLSDLPDAFERLAAALGAGFEVVTGTVPFPSARSGEVSMPGVDKGSALEAVVARCGMRRGASIAIGDHNNDLAMLRAAGIGIAMGNGTPEAKAAADEVTTAVDDDGIRNAFLRHGLI